MADHFVTVPDSLELPTDVLVPIARLSDAGTAGRAVLDAETAADARTAIGAGTSSLTVGTGAGDAKAGDYQPAAANISDSTAVGRALLTAADAAAQRAAMGAPGATDPSLTASASTATLAAETIDGTGWTLGAGWSGDLSAGFTHAPGNTDTLSRTMGATGSKVYLVSFTVASVTDSSAFTVTLGGSYGFQMYEGATGGVWTYARAIRSVSDGPLVFTPETGFDGRIYAVSAKEVSASFAASMILRDTAGVASVELRTPAGALNNVFMGSQVGRYNVTGKENAAFGAQSLAQSVSGFWNSALGYQTLQSNVNGTRNVALGAFALRANTDGHRNIAIGSFSQFRTTSGYGNVSVGYDTLWYNTTGTHNIAIGGAALGGCTSGSHNVALGLTAGGQITTGQNNIAVGQEALSYQQTGTDTVAIGHSALRSCTVNYNVGIGSSAGIAATTTTGLVAIGYQSIANLTGAANNATAIGYQAGFAATSGKQVTAIGYRAGQAIGTGDNNVAIGAFSMADGTAGDAYEVTTVGTYSGRNITTGGGRNTFFGAYAGSTTTTGSNNLCIGRNTATTGATASNEMNVGNIIYGDMTGKRVRIGAATPTAALHLPAGTAAAGTAPLKLTTGVNLTTPEAGAVEFDGTNLYFTTAAGVRKTVAVV